MGNPVWIPLWVAIIVVIPGLISAVASALNMRHLAKIQSQMGQLEKNTNNKMDKLLEVSNKASFAEGKLEGKKEG